MHCAVLRFEMFKSIASQNAGEYTPNAKSPTVTVGVPIIKIVRANYGTSQGACRKEGGQENESRVHWAGKNGISYGSQPDQSEALTRAPQPDSEPCGGVAAARCGSCWNSR